MWLWILSLLFLALVWAVWFILRPPADAPAADIFPLWVAITITAVVLLVLIGLVVFRRIRAARAARALEKAIAQQAQDQVQASKPEDRAEIQELQRQMLEGIAAIKRSKLGRGGGNALYSLPWYAMVGPPGAGKTTALRHSGLSFPYLDPNGTGIRGVGGTRNCDWWFTNEAILLDTAGRYTTEEADHDEWMAFLGMLKNYRQHKPLNGVVVAVAVDELIDASEDEIRQVGERVRDRIDEMQQTLQMVLPVYVMFTKCDLVAGFVEFFGDLRRSERGQPWGATLGLSDDKSEPGKVFDREFDLLVEHLHKRTILRMGMQRGGRREKERVYQFPLEFAAIKRNLSDFVAAAFQPAPPPASKKAKVVHDPILRGFYFTSGTQEGKPLERVVGAMGRAFGLRAADKEDEPAVEPKSYFLRDVFTGIVFPDQDVAALTEEELRRKRLQRMLAALMAAMVALVLLVPAVLSYMKNQDLVATTQRVSDEAAEVDWTDGQPATGKVDRLDRLRQHLELLDQYREEGAPIGYRWGMYQGDRLFEPTLEQYIHSLRDGFIDPVKARLETNLRQATGAKYLEEYETLKTYLLLDNRPPPAGNFKHLQQYGDWQTSRLTTVWASILRPSTSIPERDLRAKILPHTTYYVNLLKRGVVKGPELDQALVQQVRDVLRRVGPSRRYYDQFVTVLIDQKIDEAGSATRDNLMYPPITLRDMFADRPDVLNKLSSKRKQRENKWMVVQGPYTTRGRETVLASLENGYELLEREKWVVPLTIEEKQQGDKIKQALARVRQDYDEQYITQWVEFFRDIEVAIPTNNVEAIEEFKVLSTPDWPYWRLLRALRDHTQFQKEEEAAEEATKKGGVIDQIKRRVQNKVSRKLRTDVTRLGIGGGAGERVDPVPEKFKSMVEFGFPAPPKEGEPPPPSGLSSYVSNLEQLAGEMTVVAEGPPSADTATATELFEKAVKETESLLLTLDRTGQQLMSELLLNPLRQSYKAMVHSAGGSASGLWEVEVWPSYRDNIKNRYPFNRAAKRDASYDDAVAFFSPNGGVLWGFYDTNLKSFHRKVKHQFIPTTRLAGNPRPAKPYTPFHPNLYNCLERSDEITDALWAAGGEAPKVVFKINLKTVSPIVSEVVFEVDGQERKYRNEKEQWKTFQWPGPDGPSGASLRVRGAGGLSEELRREGPWGIYRLFEAGRTSARADDDSQFDVEWQMAAPPVTVKIQVKPSRANHPFSRAFFRNTNCPPSIGDRFGQ
ncbi:MAG: type VI secretion system membrane subunit TssM [Deltaproteobacteria bacterium]|jgi:type VI secretion system protein ImpL|nr:type VI secretion system membrane subunit TssM [Deltaproteobacteria bacterium]MBW2537809.1 type VI secretion system membrane subunit TssM [Deltaproteobacteria bacterium]